MLSSRYFSQRRLKKLNTITRFVFRSSSSSVGGPSTSGGLGYPAPPELRDLVKLHLLEQESPRRIQEIWEDQYRYGLFNFTLFLCSEYWEIVCFSFRNSWKILFFFPVLIKFESEIVESIDVHCTALRQIVKY